MGAVIPRKRKDGSAGYHAQVTAKRSGKIVYRETRTFDRKQAASAWLEKRQAELSKPGGHERKTASDPKLTAVIDRYIEESNYRADAACEYAVLGQALFLSTRPIRS
jgi:hypothetical protein